MTKPHSQGRMIRIDIAEDDGLSKLSDGAARMLFYLYPHLNSYGKFSGGPGTITENVIPLLRWSRKKILSYLTEINTHTSMKVWTHNGRFFVHDLRFSQQQEIREDRRGRDTLPSYPGANCMKTGHSKYSLPELLPDLLPHEVEVEVQGEEEFEVELEASRALPSPPFGRGGAAAVLEESEEDRQKGLEAIRRCKQMLGMT